MACRPILSKILEHGLGIARRLDGERQNDEIERLIRVIRKVAIRVALDHRQAAHHAQVHLLGRNLNAASVDGLGVGEKVQQRPVATAHVEHARARRHHLRNQKMVGPLLLLGRHVALLHHAVSAISGRPVRFAAAERKPRTVAWNSGSSSRKASWPLSLSISTNDTFAATALSAFTIALLSRVG